MVVHQAHAPRMLKSRDRDVSRPIFDGLGIEASGLVNIPKMRCAREYLTVDSIYYAALWYSLSALHVVIFSTLHNHV